MGDPSERRIYIVDGRADYGALDCLIGGAINLRKIEENWDEILRMTASVRAGTVAPSAWDGDPDALRGVFQALNRREFTLNTLKLSNLRSLEPDNSDTFVSSPPRGV